MRGRIGRPKPTNSRKPNGAFGKPKIFRTEEDLAKAKKTRTKYLKGLDKRLENIKEENKENKLVKKLKDLFRIKF